MSSMYFSSIIFNSVCFWIRIIFLFEIWVFSWLFIFNILVVQFIDDMVALNDRSQFCDVSYISNLIAKMVMKNPMWYEMYSYTVNWRWRASRKPNQTRIIIPNNNLFFLPSHLSGLSPDDQSIFTTSSINRLLNTIYRNCLTTS